MLQHLCLGSQMLQSFIHGQVDLTDYCVCYNMYACYFINVRTMLKSGGAMTAIYGNGAWLI